LLVSVREFGFSLSYTTFRFAVDGPTTLHTSTDAMAAAHGDYYLQGGGAEVSSPLVYTVNVTNTGSVASDVVVLGTHDPKTSASRSESVRVTGTASYILAKLHARFLCRRED
jgi:hypothetical protein